MPTSKSEIKNGITVNWIEYSPEEMPTYWKTIDRYHNDTILMMPCMCTIINCSEIEARELSSLFVNHIFSIPTCTYYDGKQLALNYSYAGGNTGRCKSDTFDMIEAYFKIKNNKS